MFIKNFQLFNYKSYIDSGVIEFSPGINIIIGQNNAGKTALLESLTFKLSNKPHRSIKTLPNFFSQISEESHAQVHLSLEKEELKVLLQQIPAPLGIPEPDHTFYSGEPELALNIVKSFRDWLEDTNNNDVEINLSLSSNPQFEVEKGKFTEQLNFDLYSFEHPINQLCQFLKININNEGRVELADIEYHYDDYDDYYQDYIVSYGFFKGDYKQTIAYKIFELFRNRIYRFYAERLNIGSCPYGKNYELKPDASNLAEVLHLLPNKNPEHFRLLNQYLSSIFPHLASVSVVNQDDSTLEIKIWTQEAVQYKREDLTIPLSECGTGISQVLAILYVIITSQFPRTIIIDEPQSFLHPGAAKKLIEVIKEFPHHQYFISTHSSMIILTASPAKIIKLVYEDFQTKALVINPDETSEQRSVLADIGVRLSDVFGADNILWVEGETEEACFPLILEKVAAKKLMGTVILAVKAVGNLEAKRARTMFDIYRNLSGGKSLYPPAIGFILDRENKTQQEMNDLKRESNNLIKFIPRRMYENYLLCPEAIAYVINQDDKERENPLIVQEIEEWIEKNKLSRNYIKGNKDGNFDDNKWLDKVDAAKLIKDLFNQLSEARVAFSKTKHSYELTKWIIEHKKHLLTDLADFLKGVLDSN